MMISKLLGTFNEEHVVINIVVRQHLGLLCMGNVSVRSVSWVNCIEVCLRTRSHTHKIRATIVQLKVSCTIADQAPHVQTRFAGARSRTRNTVQVQEGEREVSSSGAGWLDCGGWWAVVGVVQLRVGVLGVLKVARSGCGIRKNAAPRLGQMAGLSQP